MVFFLFVAGNKKDINENPEEEPKNNRHDVRDAVACSNIRR